MPGKSLLWLAGMPLVVLVARRAANRGAEVVVATSRHPSDDVLADVLLRAGISTHRGSLEDVLGRFEESTKDLADSDWVVRLTADNPIPDGGMIESVLGEGGGEVEYIRPRDKDLPYGVCLEAVKLGNLREAASVATGRGDREHVTPWTIRNAAAQEVIVQEARSGWGRLRATCDTPTDYARLQRVFAGLGEEEVIAIPWDSLCERLAATTADLEPALTWTGPGRATRPALTLGTAQLGQIGYGVLNSGSDSGIERDRQVLSAAWDLGVRSFDTARAYGEAEVRLGEVLGPRRAAEEFRITTKVGLEAKDSQDEGAVLRLDDQVFGSLAALQSSRLDAVLLHRFEDFDGGSGLAWNRLLELSEAGVISSVGVSAYEPDEVLKVVETGRCGAVQIPFNLLDDRWLEPALVEALESVQVSVRSVFLQGLLLNPFSDWPESLRAESFRGQEISETIESLVHELGIPDRLRLCLSWVKSHDWIDEIIVGAETPEQIRDVAVAFREVDPLPEEAREQVRHRLAGRVPPTLRDPRHWS